MNKLSNSGHNGLEVDYNVWYRERTVSEWRTMKILTRGVTEATLVGLRPGTEYELRVLSQDLIGDGLFSKPVFTRTLGKRLFSKCSRDLVRVELFAVFI